METSNESKFSIKTKKIDIAPKEKPSINVTPKQTSFIDIPPECELSNLKVFKSTDYDRFVILNSNRKLNLTHLQRLTQLISVNNQLHVHPILVNSNYEVIDGQHRLKVARDLGVPIYFIKSDTITRKHIVECNANQLAFGLKDFINYSVTESENTHYIRLQAMMEETSIKVKALLMLLFRTTSNDMIHRLKSDQLELPLESECDYCIGQYIRFKNYIENKNLTPKSMFIYYKFTRAFHLLIHTPGYDPEMFYQKLDYRWHLLKPMSSAKDWYHELINIYNHKNIKNAIKAMYIKE